MSDFFNTVSEIYQTEIKIQGSRFIAILYPIQNELEVKQQLVNIRKQHYNATHHCYAFILDSKSKTERASDDGEPSGTAGLPILRQLKSANLFNCLCIVVRYYGGTKLGTSGLIKAYGDSALTTIQESTILSVPIRDCINLNAPFSEIAFVKLVVKKYNVVIKENYTDVGCNFIIRPLLSKKDNIFRELSLNHTLIFSSCE